MSDIEHIGIAVGDLNKAAKIFSDILGREPSGTEEVTDQKVRVVFFTSEDNPESGRIELLAPTEDGSSIKNYLDKRGEGLHHLALRVNNIEAKLAELKAKGYRLIDETPRLGAEGKKIAFIHPSSTGGILIELTEK
jgi:methylmalonyl-CoA/ethylmalonyl-CoA epimerase